MRFLIVTAVLAAVLGLSVSEKMKFNDHKVYRLVPKDEEAVDVLKFIEENTVFSGFDFWSRTHAVGLASDLMVPPYQLAQFEDIVSGLNMTKEVLIEDVQKLIDAEQVGMQTMNTGYDWTRYHTLDEIYAWLMSIAREYPLVATLINAGRTHEGRDILGIKLTFRPGNERRSVFMESNIHAREWITAAVNTYILHQFITSTDPAIRQVADTREWYFFPVANPDGFHHSVVNNRMWRKTRVPYSLFCFGADPNRNWGYQWMQGGASSQPCSDTYGGPQPFSEPSVRNLANYIATIGTNLQAFISFHSFSQMLLLPYGYTTQPRDNYDELEKSMINKDSKHNETTTSRTNIPPDIELHIMFPSMEIGTRAMTALARRYGTRYVTGNIAETIYIATGGSMDWVKATFGTPLTYTYELRDTGTHGFLLPPAQIIPSCLETMDSIISMFNDFAERYPNA